MFGIEQRGVVAKHVNDASKAIDSRHLRTVCKIHHGKATCRYIASGNCGFVCVKKTPLKASMDSLVGDGRMSAKGDNCDGL